MNTKDLTDALREFQFAIIRKNPTEGFSAMAQMVVEISTAKKETDEGKADSTTIGKAMEALVQLRQESQIHLLGRGASYGASTTHMSKLLPRIEGGGGGGCPILVFGISKNLYVE